MKTNNFSAGIPVPTANIAVNKARLKVYNDSYYLTKGQEFEIELFNPTTNTLLAKIYLNNKPISQGGLVLRPGQRIFLDRYLDVAKKFLFDTYDVENSDEVKEAIQNNGDFKVQFFKEKTQPIIVQTNYLSMNSVGSIFGGPTTTYNTTATNAMGNTRSSSSRLFKSKSIETGRVEKGSDSTQKLNIVDKEFEFNATHVVEYKLLPISQKINTSNDINIRQYCTNCGAKVGKTHKFCASCGTKA
jgi:hypothetical protein